MLGSSQNKDFYYFDQLFLYKIAGLEKMNPIPHIVSASLGYCFEQWAIYNNTFPILITPQYLLSVLEHTISIAKKWIQFLTLFQPILILNPAASCPWST